MLEKFYNDAKVEFDKAIEFLKSEFAKLQTGRASAILVEDIMVEAYGSMQPLKNLAQINIPEVRSIFIKPWDKGVLRSIEIAITNSGQGFNPNNNGEAIILNLPQLTEERRKELSKMVGKLAEECRITIRQARQVAHQQINDAEESKEITEDERDGANDRLQEMVNEANKSVDEMAKKKEEEVMKV